MSPAKRYASNAKEWISEHEPDWKERRALARAIVNSHSDGSVTDAPFNIHRTGDELTIEGPRSKVVVMYSGELDEIMAAIAWVDAIEERFKESV